MAICPKLTKVLTRFCSDQPDFDYTTIRCSRDYAAQMHVDGTNHGPSYIVALGNSTGGQLWVLDVNDPLGKYELDFKI